MTENTKKELTPGSSIQKSENLQVLTYSSRKFLNEETSHTVNITVYEKGLINGEFGENRHEKISDR